MSRTNIDLDDVAVAEVVARFSLRTKRDAVNLDLLRRTGSPTARAMRGRLERDEVATTDVLARHTALAVSSA